MSKRSIIKSRREDIEKYFLALIKEGSAQEIKTFYSYFKRDLNQLFEEKLSKENSSNPLKAAFVRADPKIFNVFIFLEPKYYLINQNNDRALKYAIQLNSVKSGTLLLLNRQSKELPVTKTSDPIFNQLLSDFKQLAKDEFARKYATLEDVTFPFIELPIELQCQVLTKLSIGCTLKAPAVCKLWRDMVQPDPLVDNEFIVRKIFECETTLEEYYLKIELHPTVHHFCLANPKNILPKIEAKEYDASFLKLVDNIANSAAEDCIDPSQKEDLRELILNTDVEDIYYWEDYGRSSIYLKIDDDVGIGITMQELVEGNFK